MESFLLVCISLPFLREGSWEVLWGSMPVCDGEELVMVMKKHLPVQK